MLDCLYCVSRCIYVIPFALFSLPKIWIGGLRTLFLRLQIDSFVCTAFPFALHPPSKVWVEGSLSPASISSYFITLQSMKLRHILYKKLLGNNNIPSKIDRVHFI